MIDKITQALGRLLPQRRNQTMWDCSLVTVARECKAVARGSQADLDRILRYLVAKDVPKVQVAYILASIAHETAWWMQPIREGAARFGKNYTNEQSIRAVTAIFNKGIIRTNYALPAGKYGHSYYGRGMLQITWLDNYQKFADALGEPLVRNPDRALDWRVSMDITYIGIRDGMFRKGYSLDMIKTPVDFIPARNIVNGDAKANGAHIAAIANAFYNNLKEV